jgi:ATPase family associated with various cellular activities (AAA)
MTLGERLQELVRAAFSGVYVQSFEHDDAIVEIARLCRREGWSLATWDVDRGLSTAGREDAGAVPATDPLAAIRALGGLAVDGGAAILVLRNFHRFLSSVEVVQALDSQLNAGKRNRTFVVVLAPVVQIPVELERQFVVVEHDLPDRGQLLRIAQGVAVEPGELPEGDDLERALAAAAGMTRMEAENALSLALVRHGRVVPEVVWDMKVQGLKKSGLLEMHRGAETFRGLGGLEHMKSFCLRALRSRSRNAEPRGILILGVPGTGKSEFAKRLGNEVGMPTILVDLGRLKGGLVGETERRTRQALRQLSATARNIAFFDEIEKMAAGVESGGRSDGGVSAGQFGSLLTHMSDRPGESFFIFTANDVAKLPPEFTRAERLDAIFFVDLPGPDEKKAIWEIYVQAFELDPAQRRPRDDSWTGAEIKACCRLASLLEVPLIEAAANIVPVAVTAGESIERLRSWASGRCLDADRPGLFVRGGVSGKTGRKLDRSDPSLN